MEERQEGSERDVKSLLAQREEFTEAVAVYRCAIGKRLPVVLDVANRVSAADVILFRDELHCAVQTLQAEVLNLQSVMDRLNAFEEIEKQWVNIAERVQKAIDVVRARLEAEKAQAVTEAREEANACVICMEQPHNVVVIPCFHGHFCGDCLDEAMTTQETCPTCRTAIRSIIPYKL